MPDWILSANRARAVPPFGMLQNTYRTRTVQYQRIDVCILFWKIMLNRSLIVILWPICGLLKQIINHNGSKFVLRKLVLTGVCCKHFMYSSSSSRTDRWVHFQQNAGLRLYVLYVCTVRVHFLVCTWSVCLPKLWSDFYLTSKIPIDYYLI